MAYRDPYAGQAGYSQQEQQYGHQEVYNPYAPTQQPHDTYEQGGYNDYNNNGYRDEPFDHNQTQHQPPYVVAPEPQYAIKSETPSGFEQGEFTPQEKSANTLRAYRYETQGNLWTKGSRAGCIGRFCCCTILIIFFLLASIILSLALWVRPPAVVIGEISLPETGSQFQLTDSGFKINFNLNVSVSNPNYFSVDLKKVRTQLFYPINDTDIGGGTTTNVDFPSNSNKTVTFPFAIDYTTSEDPNSAILVDLLQKCGIVGTASDITISYRITLSIRILIITVSPTISNEFSFACPIDESSLEDLMGTAGISDIGSILGGS